MPFSGTLLGDDQNMILLIDNDTKTFSIQSIEKKNSRITVKAFYKEDTYTITIEYIHYNLRLISIENGDKLIQMVGILN